MDDSGQVHACLAGSGAVWEDHQGTSKLKDLNDLMFLCQEYDLEFHNKMRDYFQTIVASGRLSFPLGLSQSAKTRYINILKRYRKTALNQLIKINFLDPFFKIPEIIITRFNIDYAIEKVYQTQNTELQAFLLNYKHNVLRIDDLSAKSFELNPVNPNALREIRNNWRLANLSAPELTLVGYRGERTPMLIFPKFAGNKPITTVGHKFKTNDDKFTDYSDLEIVIPEGYKEMQFRAFSFHAGLKKITLPDSMVVIGQAAFDNSSLQEVRLGQKLTIIKEKTFARSSLKSIIIPNSVKIICAYAFSSCKSLAHVVLGNKVEMIGSWSFANCENLKAITLPASLKFIAPDAFKGSGLMEFSIDDKNPKYDVQNRALIDKDTKEVIIYPPG